MQKSVMKCAKCGSEIKEGSNFCTNCGAKIEVTNFSDANSAVKRQKDKKGGCLIFLVLLILILSAASFCVLKFLPGIELPFGMTIPEIEIPFDLKNIKIPSFGGSKTSKKFEEKKVVYYEKNSGLYLIDGGENQEPIAKGATSDLYYDEKTEYLYYIKDYSIHRMIKDDDEVIVRGEESNQCFIKGLFFDGIIFSQGANCYVYMNDEKTKIAELHTGPGGVNGICFDIENNILYVVDVNNNLYKYDENLEKELIESNVSVAVCVPGIGLIYTMVESDTQLSAGTYIYRSDNKEKIFEKKLSVYMNSETKKRGYIYLIEDIPLKEQAENYISNSILKEIGKMKVDRKYKNLYNIYLYNGRDIKLLVTNVVYRRSNNDYLLVGKSFVKDASKIDNADIMINDTKSSDVQSLLGENVNLEGASVIRHADGSITIGGEPDYISGDVLVSNDAKITGAEEVLAAINDKFFFTNNLIYYIFKGSEASIIEFDDRKYLPYNLSKSTHTVRCDERNVTISLYNEKNEKEFYTGEINIGGVTHLSKISEANSKISLERDFVTIDVDDYTYDLYDKDGQKILFEKVYDYYSSDDDVLYVVADFDLTNQSGILYKMDLSSGEKIKISSNVRGFRYRVGKSAVKTINDINITNYNFDTLGGDKIIDNYIKENCKTGWVNDSSNKNEWYYYKANHQKSTNEYLELNGKWYHFDVNGLMDKNEWVGDLYFGDDGIMKTNEWIDGEYYVGMDGKYQRNAWVGTSYVGQDGKKVKNQWVYPYYIGSDGNYVKNTVVDGKTIGADGKVIESTNTQKSSSSIEEPTSQSNGNTQLANSDKELYIDGYFTTYKDTFNLDADYESTISIKLPKVNGKNVTEVEIINDYINNDITDEMVNILETRLQDVTPAYKSISITKAEITTIQSRTIRITLSGSAKMKDGGSKTIKYRISYNREEETYDLEKIS